MVVLLLSGSVITYAADRSEASGLIITNEKRADGKKAVTAVFSVNADPELVYHTLRDVERFPEFMPGSAAVKMLEKKAGYQVVKFSGSRGLLSADIVMKRIIDDKNRKIEWSIVDGPPKEVSGYWSVGSNDNGSIVHYSNYVDAGLLIPGFLVRKYLIEDIQRMVPNIIRRIESGGTWLSGEYLEKMKNTTVKVSHGIYEGSGTTDQGHP